VIAVTVIQCGLPIARPTLGRLTGSTIGAGGGRELACRLTPARSPERQMNTAYSALNPARTVLRRRLYPLIAWPALLALIVLLLLTEIVAVAYRCSSRWRRLPPGHRHTAWKAPRGQRIPIAIP
jgi:hypothetical protein